MDQIFGLVEKFVESPVVNAVVIGMLVFYLVVAGLVTAVFVYVFKSMRDFDKRFKGRR